MIILSRYKDINYVFIDNKYYIYYSLFFSLLFLIVFFFTFENLILKFLFVIPFCYNFYFLFNPRNKFYWPGSVLEKEINEYYKMEFEYDIGSFEYDMDGFYINFERLKIYIEWNEINAIFSSYIYDEYAPEFLEVFTEKTSIRIDENIRGYHVFSNKMSEQFLQIKNNWKIDMKEHLFRKNRRLL